MISPALMLSWVWGKKRKPIPEYLSPNSYVKWSKINGQVLDLQHKLIDTFTNEQMVIYQQLREKNLEADREKPWQYKNLEI